MLFFLSIYTYHFLPGQLGHIATQFFSNLPNSLFPSSRICFAPHSSLPPHPIPPSKRKRHSFSSLCTPELAKGGGCELFFDLFGGKLRCVVSTSWGLEGWGRGTILRNRALALSIIRWYRVWGTSGLLLLASSRLSLSQAIPNLCPPAAAAV